MNDAMIGTSPPLLRAAAVSKTYRTPDHIGRLVLDHVDFTLREGEIVAILREHRADRCGRLAGLANPRLCRVARPATQDVDLDQFGDSFRNSVRITDSGGGQAAKLARRGVRGIACQDWSASRYV